MSEKSILITDLDNTLFDWVDIWYRSFSAMLDSVVATTGIDRDKLIPEIRRVHQRHGTSEYAFLLEEVPSLVEYCNGRDPVDVFEDAIRSYRSTRKEALKLFYGVMDSLVQIKGSGALIFGYTESMAFYTRFRIQRLELDGVIDILFSPKDHDIPIGMDIETLRRYPSDAYELKKTIHNYTPKGSLKPDADVLEEIIMRSGLRKCEAVYVGDSLHKDVAMAKTLGVDHAWAKYGVAQQKPEYQLLRDVTHWTDEDVEREKRIKQADVSPEVTLESGFPELLKHFRFRTNA
ncbi:MAG: HAD family hydrolase [Pseudomonadota bacterium]